MDCSVYATCQLECCFVKVSLTPIRKRQTRFTRDMIQSPRGQINFPAQNSLDSSVTPRDLNTSSVISDHITPIYNTNIDHTSQLVWTNPIRTQLNPQITRQISFSETLLHSNDFKKFV